MLRIAINGLGRIGKSFLRAVMQDKNAQKKLNLVAVNIGPAHKEYLDHMIKYDTLMKTFSGTVSMHDDTLMINGHAIKIYTELDPEKLPWKKLNIDWVVDCSGKFTKREGASKHLVAGVKNVLISAPSKDADVMIIPGVNNEMYKPTDHIVSLGSCSTNALMPMLKVLYESCGLQKGFITTTHAYTNTQALIDVDGKDPRRSRAAALNIVPTSTGAAKSVAQVIPELAGKVDGCALRVPVANVSIMDLDFVADRELTVEQINKAFEQAASSKALKGILAFSMEPLVSSDYIGDPHSVIIDGLMTRSIGTMGKAMGWYDNEWGYSERLKDFLLSVA